MVLARERGTAEEKAETVSGTARRRGSSCTAAAACSVGAAGTWPPPGSPSRCGRGPAGRRRPPVRDSAVVAQPGGGDNLHSDCPRRIHLIDSRMTEPVLLERPPPRRGRRVRGGWCSLLRAAPAGRGPPPSARRVRTPRNGALQDAIVFRIQGFTELSRATPAWPRGSIRFLVRAALMKLRSRPAPDGMPGSTSCCFASMRTGFASITSARPGGPTTISGTPGDRRQRVRRLHRLSRLLRADDSVPAGPPWRCAMRESPRKVPRDLVKGILASRLRPG